MNKKNKEVEEEEEEEEGESTLTWMENGYPFSIRVRQKAVHWSIRVVGVANIFVVLNQNSHKMIPGFTLIGRGKADLTPMAARK